MVCSWHLLRAAEKPFYFTNEWVAMSVEHGRCLHDHSHKISRKIREMPFSVVHASTAMWRPERKRSQNYLIDICKYAASVGTENGGVGICFVKPSGTQLFFFAALWDLGIQVQPLIYHLVLSEVLGCLREWWGSKGHWRSWFTEQPTVLSPPLPKFRSSLVFATVAHFLKIPIR